MALETRAPTILRFGTFEVDPRAGELRKQRKRIKLQDQPFQVKSVLLQRPGGVMTWTRRKAAVTAAAVLALAALVIGVVLTVTGGNARTPADRSRIASGWR